MENRLIERVRNWFWKLQPCAPQKRTWTNALSKISSGEQPLIIVCAWCRAILSSNAGHLRRGHVSHGICDQCLDRVLREGK